MQAFSNFPSVLLLACVTGSAWAQDTPPITLTAAYAVQADDNLLRQADGGSGQMPRDDRIGISTLGLLFHTVQGLQRLELDASVVDYRHANYSSLDYTAHNYAGAWHWAVTPRLRGNLTANQQERPNSSIGNSTPNQQRQTNYRADADYEVAGPWHVLAGVSEDQHVSQYADSANSTGNGTNSTDNRNRARDLGLRYDAPSGSWLKLTLKAGDGNYLGGSSESYQQPEQDLRVHWSISEATSLDAYVTQIERKHDSFALLDFSGHNYGSNASWAVTARSTLVLGYAHELAVILIPQAQKEIIIPFVNVKAIVVTPATGWFTEQDSLSLGWNWETSSRTQVRLRHAVQQLNYRNARNGPGDHQDNSRDTSLALLWAPGRQWQISTTLQQSSGSTPNQQNYTSNQLSLSAQFSY
jgi:exopolysaccharide biosynthesis operon protein EpsL